jgi:hypothetical protein
MTTRRSRLWPLLAGGMAVLACAAGCSQSAPTQVSSTDPFIAVTRDGVASANSVPALPVGGQGNFYIGLNRSELGSRWFLTAYLKTLFPFGPAVAGPTSLGTRVVSFHIQNDKLFVFDVSDGKASSATFDPDLVIDAFPLIHDFDGQSIANQFVIFDPAAGIDQIGFLGDAFSQGAVRFTTEITYLQDFRRISDGVTYERVFTGYVDSASQTLDYGEPNFFRWSGTLGTAFRKYTEGTGFTPLGQFPVPWYFESDPLLIPGPDSSTPRSFTWTDHWNIRPGMKPIHWVISSQVAALAKNPLYAGYDVYGAVRRGIEDWNDAFGFKVFDTRTATPDDSFGDDDVNFLVWDDDTTIGFAFANWRTNPNTGETRGASVYMNQNFLEYADLFFDDDPNALKKLTPRTRPAVPGLTWAGMRMNPLCTLWAPQFNDDFLERLALNSRTSQASGAPLTKKQKVERYIESFVTHEVGHTLGLRHNFKGSLLPPSSSVMDYTSDQDKIATPGPQAYDIAAVRFLYGLSPNAPTQPFCTDPDSTVDPDCNRFDSGAHPLTDTYAPNYQFFLDEFLFGLTDIPPNTSLNGVLQYVRAAFDVGTQEQAFRIAIDPVRTPLSAANAADPVYGPRADIAASRVLARLYLDALELRDLFTSDPPLVDGYASDVLGELRGQLLNVDGVRSFASRRTAVDILKKLQVTPAYTILLEAQAALQAQIPTLLGTERELTTELLAHIDAAISPYFY